MASNQVDVKAVITADDRASSVMTDFGNNTKKATTAIAAAMTVAGAGLMLFTKNATDYTVQLTKDTKELARETGTTVESASALLYVTQRMGISAEQTANIFGIFSKKITETASSTDASTTSLGKLGIAVKDAQGYTKDFNTILLSTADVFAKMPDGPQKTATALDLFGRSGKDLIPVLNLGSKGIADMEAQAQKLGLTLTTENVASISKYITATKNLADSQNALKVQIGTLTAPVLASLDTKLASVINKLISAAGPFKGVAAATIAVSGPVLTFGGAILGVAANLTQALPLLKAVGVGFLALAPEIAAVTAVVGVGAVAWKFFRDRTQSAGQAADDAQDALEKTNTKLQNQVTTLDDVNAAWKTYNRAQEDVVGAQLSVEQAQKDYNQAVLDYGANSLQARQAAHQLTEAQFSLQDATDKAAQAQGTLNQKQNDMIVQAPSAAAATDLIATHINGIALSADNVSTHVANLGTQVGITLNTTLNAATVIQGQFNTLQGAANTVQLAVNGAQQTIQQNIQTTIGNLDQLNNKAIGLNPNTARSTSKPIQLRASGGPVDAGSPYWVGEEGIPELFVPKQAGDIVPLNKLPSSSGGSPVSTAGGSGAPQINISVNAGAFMGSQIDARKYATLIFAALKDIATSKNMSLNDMMGV